MTIKTMNLDQLSPREQQRWMWSEARRRIYKKAAAFEPIRPLHAPDNGAAYYMSPPQNYVDQPRVDYGKYSWPSRAYWLVPLSANGGWWS